MVWVYVVALLLAVAALLLFRGDKTSEPVQEDDGAWMERCRRAAAMRNFWAYDGTEQIDAEELAVQLYRKGKGRNA